MKGTAVDQSELDKLRITPSYSRQAAKYHIERTMRLGFGGRGPRYALCGAQIRPVTKEVSLSAVELKRRCTSCFRLYQSGSR